METCFSILTWRTPWTEESGRWQSMGSQRVGHDWATEHASRQSQGCLLLVSLPPRPHAKSLPAENLLFFPIVKHPQSLACLGVSAKHKWWWPTPLLYSKLWIDSLCLFSFGWSSFISSLGFIFFQQNWLHSVESNLLTDKLEAFSKLVNTVDEAPAEGYQLPCCVYQQWKSEKCLLLSRVLTLFDPRTVACQALLSMGFPRKEYLGRLLNHSEFYLFISVEWGILFYFFLILFIYFYL